MQTARPNMFLTFCVGGVTSSIVYLVKNVNVFYKTILQSSHTTALYYLFYASFILMISMPIFGAMTDFFGRARMVVYSAIAATFTAIPIFLLMSSPIVWQQILALTFLGMLAGAISGASYIFIISLFTPEQRFSGVAFSFNSGIAVFGGTTPIITIWLSKKIESYNTGFSYIAPAFYIMITSSVFLLIIYCMRFWLKERVEKLCYGK